MLVGHPHPQYPLQHAHEAPMAALLFGGRTGRGSQDGRGGQGGRGDGQAGESSNLEGVSADLSAKF